MAAATDLDQLQDDQPRLGWSLNKPWFKLGRLKSSGYKLNQIGLPRPIGFHFLFLGTLVAIITKVLQVKDARKQEIRHESDVFL